MDPPAVEGRIKRAKRRPRHLDSPSVSPPPPPLRLTSAHATSAQYTAILPTAGPSNPIGTKLTPANISPISTTTSGHRKISVTSSALFTNPPVRLSVFPVNPPSSRSISLNLTTKPRTAPSFPATDSYVPIPVANPATHPRELVPLNIGWPPAGMGSLIRAEDKEDRLLMAICAVLHAHQNRALCPKEVAEVMFERGWLHNA
jgi:hypothetical protein